MQSRTAEICNCYLLEQHFYT